MTGAPRPPASRSAPRIGYDVLFATVVGVCMVNGVFSPYVAIALQIAPVLMPEAFPRSVGWALFFSSIIVATGTLLLSGIPSALYERYALPRQGGDATQATAALWLWLTVATLLSLPALENIDRVM